MLDDEAWNRGIAALNSFKKREGHCRVPRYHKENGYRLGQWVAVQRYEQDDLLRSRKAQLDKIGFVWSELDRWWEEAFAALKAFKAREGHGYVPVHHVEGGVHLGHWMTVQRRCRKKKKMDRERRQRLDKIGFVWNGRYTKAIKHRLAECGRG
jgi:Helicase associated domain